MLLKEVMNQEVFRLINQAWQTTWPWLMTSALFFLLARMALKSF